MRANDIILETNIVPTKVSVLLIDPAGDFVNYMFTMKIDQRYAAEALGDAITGGFLAAEVMQRYQAQYEIHVKQLMKKLAPLGYKR